MIGLCAIVPLFSEYTRSIYDKYLLRTKKDSAHATETGVCSRLQGGKSAVWHITAASTVFWRNLLNI